MYSSLENRFDKRIVRIGLCGMGMVKICDELEPYRKYKIEFINNTSKIITYFNKNYYLVEKTYKKQEGIKESRCKFLV